MLNKCSIKVTYESFYNINIFKIKKGVTCAAPCIVQGVTKVTQNLGTIISWLQSYF